MTLSPSGRNIRLFDTHCHPQFRQFDADREKVLRRSLDARVHIICVGTDLESSRAAIALSERYEGLYASVGLHPNDNLQEEYDQDVYAELAKHDKVVAIGEIGLDYYRTTDSVMRNRQRRRFIHQLDLVHSSGMPAIIHCRDAHDDMAGILAERFPSGGARGVIHSFTGTWSDASAYLKLGLHIGLNGIVTFARDYDETAKNAPLERILLETDAPYLAPYPFRGRRNEPFYIIETAQKLAELRDTGINEIEKATTYNALALFIYRE